MIPITSPADKQRPPEFAGVDGNVGLDNGT